MKIGMDTLIQIRIHVRYSRPDAFIYDKVKNETIIVEVEITSIDSL